MYTYEIKGTKVKMYLIRKFKPSCLPETSPMMSKFIISIMIHRLYILKIDLR